MIKKFIRTILFVWLALEVLLAICHTKHWGVIPWFAEGVGAVFLSILITYKIFKSKGNFDITIVRKSEDDEPNRTN